MTTTARNRRLSKTTIAKSAEKDARIAQLTEDLAEGIGALSSTDEWKRYLEFQAQFPRYSFGNVMLILLQCPGASLVMPYGKPDKAGTWMSIGRYARSGEKALYIRKPAFRRVKAEDSADGREHVIPRFVWVPVFDVSQTDGDPLPEDGVSLLRGEAPAGLLAQVTAFIESSGYSVELVPSIPGSAANGDCDYSLRRVRVCTEGRDTLQQLKTAIHEAAHMILHGDSLLDRGQKELEAESVAYVVARHHGLSTDGYSFGYVLGWSANSAAVARKRIQESGQRISTAARAILEGTGAVERREYDDQPGEGADAVAEDQAVAA